ncbi:hypothetical protein H8K33_12645 [Undibacterium amnicola]|uniref:Uncharacterized protein n=1 Tax=Undibacterium amnicola TaxID=1834038 RepID=A0ABR6XS83_9BURK|nr:hypothetical protein [Undibacterium amnicola]MBC3832365.1 hypothetical protein [Undibacterium amnicola]
MQSAPFKSDPQFQYPPVWRRVLCTLAYSMATFAGISLLGVLLVHVDCQIDAKCSARDRIVDTILSAVWVVATLFAGYKAWRGELAGCRKQARP